LNTRRKEIKREKERKREKKKELAVSVEIK
jgi:hypothetical protein